MSREASSFQEFRIKCLASCNFINIMHRNFILQSHKFTVVEIFGVVYLLLSRYYSRSLVPRPSKCPVFDRLQYTASDQNLNTGGKAWLFTWEKVSLLSNSLVLEQRRVKDANGGSLLVRDWYSPRRSVCGSIVLDLQRCELCCLRFDSIVQDSFSICASAVGWTGVYCLVISPFLNSSGSCLAAIFSCYVHNQTTYNKRYFIW